MIFLLHRNTVSGENIHVTTKLIINTDLTQEKNNNRKINIIQSYTNSKEKHNKGNVKRTNKRQKQDKLQVEINAEEDNTINLKRKKASHEKQSSQNELGRPNKKQKKPPDKSKPGQENTDILPYF